MSFGVLDRALKRVRETAWREHARVSRLEEWRAAGLSDARSILRAFPGLTLDGQELALLVLTWERARGTSELARAIIAEGPPELAGVAATAFSSTASARSVRDLVLVLPTLPKERLLAAIAALSLVSHGVTHALRALLDSARSESDEVAELSLLGIGDLLEGENRRRFPTREVAMQLRPLLEAESPRLRGAACYTLGCLRSEDVVPRLEQIAQHDHAETPDGDSVSSLARVALTKIRSL
jgi:hypothetical protein